MNYNELLPVDKPPYPFARDANGGFLPDVAPAGVLSKDALMQGYYIKILQAAQRIDVSATISNDSGIAAITMPDGKRIDLTNQLWAEINAGVAKVEGQLTRAGIVAPPSPSLPPVVAPTKPIRQYNVAIREPGTNDWFKWQQWPIGADWKVACDPPAGFVPIDPAALAFWPFLLWSVCTSTSGLYRSRSLQHPRICL